MVKTNEADGKSIGSGSIILTASGEHHNNPIAVERIIEIELTSPKVAGLRAGFAPMACKYTTFKCS